MSRTPRLDGAHDTMLLELGILARPEALGVGHQDLTREEIAREEENVPALPAVLCHNVGGSGAREGGQVTGSEEGHR